MVGNQDGWAAAGGIADCWFTDCYYDDDDNDSCTMCRLVIYVFHFSPVPLSALKLLSLLLLLLLLLLRLLLLRLPYRYGECPVHCACLFDLCPSLSGLSVKGLQNETSKKIYLILVLLEQLGNSFSSTTTTTTTTATILNIIILDIITT